MICAVRGVGNSGHFGTVRTISTVPLGATSQGHYNQQVYTLVWAEMAGGLCGGFVFRRASQQHHNQPINRCISFRELFSNTGVLDILVL